MACCPKNLFHALPQGAVGLAKATHTAITGEGAARPETVASRESICRPCEWVRLGGKVCAACFCFLPAKRSVAGFACCKGKWGPEVNASGQ